MRRRSGIDLLVVCAVASSLLTLFATPGYADPPPPDVPVVAGVGSLALEQVDRSLADTVRLDGQAVMASYATAGTATVNTSETGDPACTINRPKNDTDGFVALLTSIRNGTGCVDFARMSGRSGLTMPNDVNLSWVPFAEDGFTFAVTNTSNVSRQLSWVDVRDIYRCVLTGYRPMLPAYGSQLRSQWLAFLQIPEVDVDLGHFPCIVDDVAGVPVVENDGTVLDGFSLVPFSLAGWQAQYGGKAADVRGRAVPGWITGSPGFSAPPLTRNTAAYGDGLTFVVTSTSNVPRLLSLADLRDIYRCQWSSLKPSLPASTSSATRAAWLARLGISEADVQAGVYPCIRTTSPAGQPIVDNDVRFLDGWSLVPLDIDEFLRQTFGISADRRGTGVLGTLVGTDGGTPLPTRIADSVQFPVRHLVYHVLPTLQELASPWRPLFLGLDSLVCTSPLVAESGFDTIGSTDATPCGIADLYSGPAETTSRTSFLYPSAAVPESTNGIYQRARFGRCEVVGRYGNLKVEVDSIIVQFLHSGPSCRVRVELVLWDYDDYVMEYHQREFTNLHGFGTNGFVISKGGLWNQHEGHTVESVSFVVSDDLYVGSSNVVIFGPPKNWTTQTDCPRIEPSTNTTPVKRFVDKNSESHLLGCDRLVHIEERHTYHPLTWGYNYTDECIEHALRNGTRTQSGSNVNNWQWTWNYDVRLRNGTTTTNTAIVIERKSDRRIVTAYTLQSDQDRAPESTPSGGTVGDWFHCRMGTTAASQSALDLLPAVPV